MEQTRYWIELVARAIESMAVTIMAAFIFVGTVKWLFRSAQQIEGTYERYRIILGKTLLVGLELLVAADIINTVAFALTLENIALLGGLVLVRTVLGWTVTLEIEGRWPWQPAPESRSKSTDAGISREARNTRAMEA